MKTLYVPASRKLDFYKNSDYLYSWELLRLADYTADLKTTCERNILLDIRTWSLLALGEARRRLNLPIPRERGWGLSQFYLMPSTGQELTGADAVLAYERYPVNAPLPVIWITGPTDIEKQRRLGVGDREIQQELNFKHEANTLAEATILTTQSKKELFDREVRPSKPTEVIPFFQPIEPIARSRFTAKWDGMSPTKMLFVGREGMRKGLPLVLDAYVTLRRRYGDKVSLQIVSKLSGGHVRIPRLPGLVHDREVIHRRVIELLRESHYLLMPSEVESYGWVHIEAMAQGAIPVATDLPVQRDLLDGGRAGWLIERTASAIADVVARGIEQPDSARQLASQAVSLWRARYAPEVVARQFAALVHSDRGAMIRPALQLR